MTFNERTTHMLRKLTILLGALFLIISCAKERPEQLTQTWPKDAVEVSSLNGKVFEIKTLEPIADSNSMVTNAQNTEVEENNIGLTDMRRVTYQTTAPYFEDVPFIGLPNKTYKLLYELVDNKLIISKIVKNNEIPFGERTSAIALENGESKIPLISYSISLIKGERALNVNNEPTHETIPISVKQLSQASHVIVDRASRRPMEGITENNIFNSDLLDGEWFFAATVVSASPEQANSIGRDVSMDFRARSVSRIKFEKFEDSIVGQNLNTDENIATEDSVNLKDAIAIPAEYFDVKLDSYGNIVNGDFEKVDENDNRRESVDYKKRKFMKLSFAGVISAMTRSRKVIKCVNTDNGESCFEATEPGLSNSEDNADLDSLEIGSDYLAFVVYHKAEKVKIRYALRKAHTPKKGRVYFKDDRKTFGFFETTRQAILNHRYERESARERLTFLNRFYPEDGKIVYYFSKTTPEHMKEAGRVSIRVWDKAFQDAGTGIRVVLDESKTVNLGDIRYNIINIVDTKDGARLLGYGPSIVDTESGEIISATSNIYANPFRETWIDMLRNYVRNKVGMFDNTMIGVSDPSKMTYYKSFIDGKLGEAAQEIPLKRTPKTNEALLELGIDSKTNLERILEAKTEVLNDQNLHIVEKPAHEGMFHYNAFDTNYEDAISEIESTCGEDLSDYIEALKLEQKSNSEVTHLDSELALLNSCADQLLEKSVVATLIHELGHNFGLRHNFVASTDTKNFIRDENGRPLANTSSIMDYQPGNVRELLVPGPYDVAAVRFGYGNKVLLKDGSATTIDTEVSLASQVQNKSLEPVKYKYCTDQDVQRTDPLCQRHDNGTTPLEIVKNTIDAFNASYTLYGHRYDRAWGPSSARFAVSHFQRTFAALKKIHDQWRYHLREFTTESNQYLDIYDNERYKAVVEEMKNAGGRFTELYNKYYEASDLAYNFIKNIVFTPAKVCVGRVKNTAPERNNHILIDFEEVKEKVFAKSGLTIDACDHVLATEELNTMGLDFVGSFGRFYEEQKETLDISDVDRNLSNVVGFKLIRRMALLALTMRTPMMEHLATKRFKPNFLDNPIYREEIVNMTLDRVLNGLNAEPFGFINNGQFTRAFFNREKDYLKDLMIDVVNGTLIPDEPEKADQRKKPFEVNKVTNSQFVPDSGVAVTRYRYFYFFVGQRPQGQKLPSQIIIEKREELKELVQKFEQNIPELRENIETIVRFVFNGSTKSADELKAMNVGQFFSYLKSLEALANEQGELGHADTVVVADNLITPVLQVLQATVGAERQEAEEGSVDPVKKNIVEFLAAYNAPEVLITQFSTDEIGAALEAIVPAIREEKRELDSARAFRQELESHLDLLTQILLEI